MCAILDNNAVHEVFGDTRTDAGDLFRRWIEAGRERFVVGGKQRRELSKNMNFREWLEEAERSKIARIVSDPEVDALTEKLKVDKVCQSNDQHAIALAQISGARLLYSHDGKLKRDFKNRNLIADPRGKVYESTDHKHLLRQANLCRSRMRN